MLHVSKDVQIPENAPLSFNIKIHEDFWTRTDGLLVGREHLLMALADVDFILIRASDNTKRPR